MKLTEEQSARLEDLIEEWQEADAHPWRIDEVQTAKAQAWARVTAYIEGLTNEFEKTAQENAWREVKNHFPLVADITWDQATRGPRRKTDAERLEETDNVASLWDRIFGGKS